jgi:asparaginyl-tRNA synthetase
MTYSEAMDELENAASKNSFHTQPKWGDDLQREHELHLLSVTGQLPVFITDFPAAIKPFYARTLDSDTDIVSSVDLLVPGVGEVVGGSVREERETVLTDRLTRLGLLEKYQWYLDLRRYGTVPHGGFGLGFERLLQAFLGVADIRDVIPFPRYLGSCQM